MPRVLLKKKEYMATDLTKLIREVMYEKGISQKAIADALGITQQGFSKKLHECKYEYKELLTIFSMLELSDNQILKAMKK